MPGALRTLRRTRVRRLIVACAIAHYLLVASGVPVPVAAGPKSGERYPCEGHNCGCRSAEHCWRSCCCHTHEERLAWAREDGVTPPAFVLVAELKPAPTKPKCPHCCSKATPPAPSPAVDDDSSVRWVSYFAAQRCRAGTSNWVNLPWSCPPPQPIEQPTFVTASEPIAIACVMVADSPAFEPAEPPPRLG
jgi:hypothetical protein